LKSAEVLACISDMSTTLIEVRRAKPSDATAIAATHDEAWRGAYQGVIPGPELEKLINRRGPQWWDSAIRKGSRIAVLAFGDCVAGYANYGRNRARQLVYTLYTVIAAVRKRRGCRFYRRQRTLAS